MSYDVEANRDSAIYQRGSIDISKKIFLHSPAIDFVEFSDLGHHEVAIVTQSIGFGQHVGYSKVRHFGTREWQDRHTGSVIAGPGFEQRFESTELARIQLASVKTAFAEAVLDCSIDAARIRQITKPSRDIRVVQYLLAALRDEAVAHSPNGLLFCESVAVALVAAASEGPLQRSVDKPLPNTAIRRLPDFIEAHLDQKLSLEWLAKEAGVSVRQLTDSFRKSFGLSVHQYVQERRVLRATALLRLGMPLSDVAQFVGIESRTSLARIFQKVAGMTPATARRSSGFPRIEKD